MKNISGLIMFALLIVSCGGSSGSNDPISNGAIPDVAVSDPVTIPEAIDTATDITSEKPFDFSTVTTVQFDITIVDESNTPVENAMISLLDEKDNLVTRSTSDSSGLALFNVSVEKKETAATLKIEQEQFVEKTVSIDDVGSLEAVIRTISLKKAESAVVKTDSDKDGIADESDEFPLDRELAFSSIKEFTLAFEDLYPSKGDADFNDAVVTIIIVEKINSKNEVVESTVTAIPLASGAGYRNLFGIYINGVRYEMIKDLKASFGGAWNSYRGEKAVTGIPAEFNVRFDKPVPRDQMQSMPYDPFIVPNNTISKGEVHLPSVETVYKGIRLDSDNFPWAIIVPDSWQWPYEKISIKAAYPEFEKWYLSEGVESADWYLKSDPANVFSLF